MVRWRAAGSTLSFQLIFTGPLLRYFIVRRTYYLAPKEIQWEKNLYSVQYDQIQWNPSQTMASKMTMKILFDADVAVKSVF